MGPFSSLGCIEASQISSPCGYGRVLSWKVEPDNEALFSTEKGY